MVAFIFILKVALDFIVFLILIYTLRHYGFTLNRLFGKQRYPYINIDTASWPSVTIVVCAHNEEAVISHSLQALLEVHYPADKLKILVVNDRSTDRTQEIVDDFSLRFPNSINNFHRLAGKLGKAAALRDSTPYIESDIIIVFDADYIPGCGLIKQLVTPFFDPEVGLVMGRVVPLNTGHNMLTRLLDLERAGGYQVDQQARMNLKLVPQYGGTVGGVRMAALESVGGWLEDTLAEDTDLTYRAILKGWKSVYQNRSECYEEVPETWSVRIRQIRRWAQGHNQVMCRYASNCFSSPHISVYEKIDGLLLLGVYSMSPVILTGWILAITLFYLHSDNLINGSMALIAISAFGSVGNFAAFFEIGAAVYLDRGKNRIRLLPFNLFSFLISTLTVSVATVSQIFRGKSRCNIWEKTTRFRRKDFVIGATA